MELILSYRGRPASRSYEGFISSVTEEHTENLVAFSSYSFEDMLMSLSQILNEPEYHDSRVTFQRTDRPGTYPYPLDIVTIHVLRQDPMAAAAMMTIEDRVIRVRDEIDAGSEVKVVLRAGHDTIADAFGDLTYLRRRDLQVESPFDGRWVTCEFPTYAVNDKWVVIETKALLKMGKERNCSRYFIPRLWNIGGPWISHADLEKKYEEYLKEKEPCSAASK